MEILNNYINNPNAVVDKLLKEFPIKISKKELTKKLENHPDYPSILSIADCLMDVGVETHAVRLEKNIENLECLEFPTLAHIDHEDGGILIIYGIKNGMVKYGDGFSVKEIKIENFIKIWSGICLYISNVSPYTEPFYKENMLAQFLIKWRVAFVFSCMVCLLFLLLQTNVVTWNYATLLVINFAGLFTSGLIVMKTLNIGESITNRFCRKGAKNDCGAILDSPSAKITEWLSWGDVGLVYFAGNSIALLILPDQIFSISLISFSSLIYPLYSFYKQAVLKHWCILCNIVQGILIIQGLLLGLTISLSAFHFDISRTVALVLAFLFPMFLWSFIKPLILAKIIEPQLRKQLKDIKFNIDHFRGTLLSQRYYELPNEIHTITQGNTEASTVITLVSNMYCDPCAKVHQKLHELLEFRTDLALKIIFLGADAAEPMALPARHILSLEATDRGNVEVALNSWYGQTQKNYENWSKIHPVEIDKRVDAIISQHNEWCEQMDIGATPTILINGYELPEYYLIEDLKYLNI